MKPFNSNSGDNLETGLHNEQFIISSLKDYVRNLSDKQYTTGKVVETGLVIHREVQVCDTSPDGIFELYRYSKWEKKVY